MAARAEWFIVIAIQISPAFGRNMHQPQVEDSDMRLATATMATLLAGFQCLAVCHALAGETENQNVAEIPWPTKS